MHRLLLITLALTSGDSWSSEDVQGIRPDLSDAQAFEVLERVRDKHDAEGAINWTTLETVADDMFPESDDEAEKPHGN